MTAPAVKKDCVRRGTKSANRMFVPTCKTKFIIPGLREMQRFMEKENAAAEQQAQVASEKIALKDEVRARKELAAKERVSKEGERLQQMEAAEYKNPAPLQPPTNSHEENEENEENSGCIGAIGAIGLAGGIILLSMGFNADSEKTATLCFALGSVSISIGIMAIVFLWINTFFRNVLALLQRIADRLDKDDSK